ncbi:hypothetical protein KFL_003280060 [Klebsormidium nitens]|uniref:FAD-binding PCMH-type domain-containing protein n=1 Tax=Klebsormidium nitens TaxID=105231 RepID=A0A1Y1IAR6_KLENI|nr:hypothetical protein KFL_003280060 [Klebsormidium nitens]|eukprot:GAQ87052.1 hypothetical protein KFL_003280060 [Klebsormidium nitens]
MALVAFLLLALLPCTAHASSRFPWLFGYNGTGCLRIPSIPFVGYCGIPYELSNFQGLYECPNECSMGRPKTLEDVKALVRDHSSVKAVGAGLSWNAEQFCPEALPNSIGIAMTELTNLRPLFTEDPSDWDTGSPEFPIQVDKENLLVTVDAGVPLRTLLNFLAYPAFLLSKDTPYSELPQYEPGYFLKGVSQIMDVTVGGGVATSTHGSSQKHSTLSSQVVAIDVILANGTEKHFTKEDNPHLFKALQVNVGQLGIVTRLTFEIVPQPVIKRTRTSLTAYESIAKLTDLANAWKNGKAQGKSLQEVMAENGYKDFIVLWFMALDDKEPNTWYLELEEDPTSSTVPLSATEEVLLQKLLNELHDFNGAATAKEPEDRKQVETAAVPQNCLLGYGAKLFSEIFRSVVSGGLDSITAPALIGYPTLRPEWLAIWALVGRTKEYEVCVPLEEIGEAMDEMLEFFEEYKPEAKYGFRTPTGFRLADEEDAYLASGNGGPRICMEIDDFSSLNTDSPNWQVKSFFPDDTSLPESSFHSVELYIEVPRGVKTAKGVRLNNIVSIMLKHNGRLHWGKAGMDEFGRCFRGAEQWGKAWCDFGCAVQELDPEPRKFQSSSPIWEWHAKKGARAVSDFQDCCTADGFSPLCTCDPGPRPVTCTFEAEEAEARRDFRIEL